MVIVRQVQKSAYFVFDIDRMRGTPNAKVRLQRTWIVGALAKSVNEIQRENSLTVWDCFVFPSSTCSFRRGRVTIWP
jgi:hypothetical protein